MKRAVIYARFSTDLQDDSSIADQVALCRDVAERQGWSIGKVYADHAASGSTVHRRPQFAQMVADAEAGQFEIMLTEDADRLSRGEGDLPLLRRQMEFLNIEIHTCADGHVTKIHAGLKGLMNSIFLDNLALHIRRGLAGVVREGRHPGGKAYGYRPVAGKPGELEIVPHEADIVRRIFEQFAAGDMPRDIATALNAEKIRPPRGLYWRGSTIAGAVRLMTGLIQNELYVGIIVWNRHHKVRNPATGKRVDRRNAESEWQRVAAPHLRIVDDVTFKTAQKIRDDRSRCNRQQRRKPKRLLSGLLRCGACGGGMSIKDCDYGRFRILCSQMKETGTCNNRRAYYLDNIERRVVERLRMDLGSREAVTHYIRCYNAARQEATASETNARIRTESRLTAATREIDRTVELVIKHVITDQEAQKRLPDLRAERDRLAAELATLEEPTKIVTLHPAAVEAYLSGIERLDELINEDLAAGDQEAARTIRGLIERVTVRPAPTGIDPDLVLEGSLAGLVGSLLQPSPASGDDTLPGNRHHLPPRPVFRFVLDGRAA